MATQTELDILKELPGYKAILRSVLKSQIQLLMQQLSENVGEESIILTASVTDGSLSHLGSNTGKGFIDGRDEIKSQFLGYCLKNHHQLQQRDAEDNGTAVHQGRSMLPQHLPRRYRKRPSPYSVSNQNINPQVTSASLFSRNAPKEEATQEAEKSGYINDNVEGSDESGFMQPGAGSQSQELAENHGDETQEPVNLKQEQEGSGMGENSVSEEAWSQERKGASEQAAYQTSGQAQSASDPKNMEPLGGIAFPGLDNSHHDFSQSTAEISPTDLKKALYPEGKPSPFTSYTPEPVVQKRAGRRDIGVTDTSSGMRWCCYCDKFLLQSEYNEHALGHCKPNECNICHRRFAGKQVLQTHMRLHSGEKPFKCDFPGCDRAFCARSGLVYHTKKQH